MKRQKRSNSGVTPSGFDFQTNLPMTPQGNKTDNMPPLMRNVSFGGHLPALSEGQGANKELEDILSKDDFLVEDVLFDRS